MSPGFIDFSLKRPMPSFEFRKVGFHGHVLEFSFARLNLTQNYTMRMEGIRRAFDVALQQSPFCLSMPTGRLERNPTKSDTFGCSLDAVSTVGSL
jgi:hypothetical protein